MVSEMRSGILHFKILHKDEITFMVLGPFITCEGAVGSGWCLFITGPCRETVNECCYLVCQGRGDERSVTYRGTRGERLCVEVHICRLVQQLPAHTAKISVFNESEWR